MNDKELLDKFQDYVHKHSNDFEDNKAESFILRVERNCLRDLEQDEELKQELLKMIRGNE